MSLDLYIAARAAAFSSRVLVVSSNAGSGPSNSPSNREYCSLWPLTLNEWILIGHSIFCENGIYLVKTFVDSGYTNGL